MSRASVTDFDILAKNHYSDNHNEEKDMKNNVKTVYILSDFNRNVTHYNVDLNLNDINPPTLNACYL